MPDPADAFFACNRDHATCAPCGARRILEHGRDTAAEVLLDAHFDGAAAAGARNADVALFVARLMEQIIRDFGDPAIGLLRGALMLAEANAKAARKAQWPEVVHHG
jgi:hypothetical protein